jgi:uncharacterized protein
MVDVLVRAYRPERVYLFGSKAPGDDGPDSDYDILLVVPTNLPRSKKRGAQAILWKAGLTHAADVVIWTKDSFEAKLKAKSSLPSSVVAEGKPLYGT